MYVCVCACVGVCLGRGCGGGVHLHLKFHNICSIGSTIQYIPRMLVCLQAVSPNGGWCVHLPACVRACVPSVHA